MCTLASPFIEPVFYIHSRQMIGNFVSTSFLGFNAGLTQWILIAIIRAIINRCVIVSLIVK